MGQSEIEARNDALALAIHICQKVKQNEMHMGTVDDAIDSCVNLIRDEILEPKASRPVEPHSQSEAQ
jgi:hypothetical protein